MRDAAAISLTSTSTSIADAGGVVVERLSLLMRMLHDNRQQRDEHDADDHQLEILFHDRACCRTRSPRRSRGRPRACRP